MHAPKRLFSHSSEDLPFPAEGMSWDEAIDFCRLSTAYLRQQEHLGPDHEIDLPSEAEWEYACRAGTTSPWHFGEDPSALADYGWYRDNSSQTKHPVALKKPNPWGIYDLYGNLSEWCRDDFHKYRVDKECDPDYFDVNGLVKITRGGDFSSPSGECRSGHRGSSNRDNPFNEAIGMRIVCRQAGLT
jgi:formylglycine-generating enzyme required for sulfatase activity